ncbi:IS5 family transposase [Streptomyces sp. NPDC000348]|uniref:IS5 family transposase n=1 Tax=Streptomyces sp. NPDC000348 TaxID=3364538 RepID=UPI0036952FCA
MSVRWVITDAMWDRIEPLMSADPVRGRRWADHRRTLEAIAWKYRTNSPWRDLPDELGSFRTAHKRLIRWAVDGTWEMILTTVLAAADADEDIDWTVSVDSTVVRAHQHAAGAPPKGAARTGEPADHALGRSRGGLSTKVHLAADGRARPLVFTVTAGQAGDAPAFETVMSRIRVPRTGPGRPRTRPLAVLADHAYSSRAIRSHLRRRGIRAVIPQPSDQIGHRLRRGRLGGARRFDGARACRLAVFRWTTRYNTRRRHSANGQQAPIAYEQQSAALTLAA